LGVLVHLVRHGRVHNPHKVVYGRQPGWSLSEEGRGDARRAAEHLRGRPLARVYSSPLERALETAEIVAAACGAALEVRDELVESLLCEPWFGRPWREVHTHHVREWMRYLRRPHEIRGVSEPLAAMAVRMEAAVRGLAAAHPEGEVAAVSHGDPIKAAVLSLTGGDLRRLHHTPVPTGGIVTLEITGGRVEVRERWSP
jgi:broad specificity phosphatase PhoE